MTPAQAQLQMPKLTLTIEGPEGERRAHARIAADRPCKIFDPILRRYLAGNTRDISGGGVLIDIPRLTNLKPGDRLHVGIAFKRRDNFLRADEMIEAEVVRAMATVDDHTALAVKWTTPREQQMAAMTHDAEPLRIAA